MSPKEERLMYLYLWLKNWLSPEDGQDLIEYALIIALLVVVAVVGLGAAGAGIDALFDRVTAWLATAIP
jgi:Flp pilus assembly pilin Flp